MYSIIKSTLGLLFIANALISSAQETFVFNYSMKELEEVELTIELPKHVFGDEIATKFQLLRESYTYSVTDEISKMTKTEMDKPAIFNSVRKIERYVKKAVKKGNMPREKAIDILNTALNVALNIRYQDTIAFEDLLWSIKDPTELIVLYRDRITLEM